MKTANSSLDSTYVDGSACIMAQMPCTAVSSTFLTVGSRAPSSLSRAYSRASATVTLEGAGSCLATPLSLVLDGLMADKIKAELVVARVDVCIDSTE